jgi:hypothetical protein
MDEGRLGDDFGGRRWVVQVRSMEEAVKGLTAAKDQARAARRQAMDGEDEAAILRALGATLAGESPGRHL